MRKGLMGVAAVAMMALTGVAHAQEEKKVTIGVSIPAADHGWTAGVVFHAERVAKLLMEQHPGLPRAAPITFRKTPAASA